MSGIERSGGMNQALQNQGVNLKKLDELVALDSSAIRLKSDGKFGSDIGMVFRSGLNSIFHEKNETDAAKNRATLESILKHVYNEVGGDSALGKKLYDKILDSEISLDGDEGRSFTLADRLERGTYVSSDLVLQIKMATGRVVQEHDEVYQNEKKFLPGNLGTIDDFVGWQRGTAADKVYNETKIEWLGNAMVNLANSVRDAIFGEKDPPFVEIVRDLCEHGTEKYGPENKELWRTVGRDLLGKDGKTPYVPQLLENLMRSTASKAAKEGREVTHEELKETVLKYFDMAMVMPPYVQATNHRVINSMTPQQLADSLEKWPKLNGREDLQKAADWLAAKVRKLGTEEADQEGLLAQVKKLISNKSEDGRDVGKMFDDMYSELKAGHEKYAPPPGLKGRELREWHHENVPLEEIRERILHPKAYDTESIAGFMGKTTENLLEMYKQDLENLDRNELREKQASELKLRSNLPPDLFPHLTATKDRMSLDRYQQLGMPETAKDFMKSVMMDQIGRDEHRRLTSEALQRSDVNEQGLSREAQNRVGVNSEMYVKNNAWMLDEILTPFDKAIEFRRQVEEVRNAPGGFEKASPETLDRLDDMATELYGDARSLVEYAETLGERYGDDGVAASTLGFSANDLLDFVSLYRNESGRDARVQAKIEAAHREVAGVYENLQRAQDGGVYGGTIPDVGWLSQDVNDRLGSFPQLKQSAGDLERLEGLPQRTTVGEVISDLVHPNGMQDRGWTDIAPGLQALDTYSSVTGDYNRLKTDGLRQMPINELEQLREKTMEALASVGQLEQSVTLIGERYGNGSPEFRQLKERLDLAVEQVRNGGQQILDQINQIRTERAPGALPRLPDIGWAHGGLKDRLESFPSLHKLARGTDFERAPYLGQIQTINNLVQGLVQVPHKLALDQQHNQMSLEGMTLTLQSQKDADEVWAAKFEERLKPLDDFAVLEKEVRLLGREGLRNLSVEERQALRERAETAHRAAGRISYVGNLINSTFTGNPDIPLAEVTDALDEAARRMQRGAQDIVEELGGFGDPIKFTVVRNETVQTPPTDAPTTNQGTPPSGTVGTNPFDDGDDVQVTTQSNTVGTNPFDDGDDVQVTTQSNTAGTNPFDDGDDVQVTTQSNTVGTNPFDEGNDVQGTNPFDDGDDVQVTTPGTTAPQERIDTSSLGQTRLPRIGWATDDLQQQLGVLPELHGLAINQTVPDGAPLTQSNTVSGMLHSLMVVPYLANIDGRLESPQRRDEETRQGQNAWRNRIESRLDSVDRFARLQNDWLTLGDGTINRLSTEERTTIRNEAQGILDSIRDLQSGINFMFQAYGEDPKLPMGETTYALRLTADRMDTECRRILAALGNG